jgi:1-acyl-sn-glycerol-3-phosphate acyltransferase
MTRALLVGLVRLLTGIRAHWREPGDAAGQRVYFANHSSNLDAVVVWASLPKSLRERTRPVAAQDYWLKSAVRRYLALRVLNAVLIERIKVTAKTNPLTPMLAAIDEGSSLILFPEGGRMEGTQLSSFKSGIYHLASHRPDLQFVPAWIDNVNRVLPKGEILPVPMLGSITMGPPLKLEPEESRESFLERAKGALETLQKH